MEYSKTLDNIGSDIRSGKPVTYTESEIQRLLEQKKIVEEVTRLGLLKYLFRFFLPMIIGLIVIWTLVFITEILKRGE
jgi:hypothetical protein